MTTTRWWWVRHAPVPERAGWCYGQQDLAADCSATASFQALAGLLPRDALWVTSHLQRTAQTAQAIGAAGYPLPTPLLVERDFVEQSYGDWQGKHHDELRSAPGSVYTKYGRPPAHFQPPNGESFKIVVERVRGGIARFNGAHAGRDIVVVAHVGSIRAAIVVALGLDPELAYGLSIDNLSVTRLSHVAGSGGADGHWLVGHINHPPR
jgi:alpha-ribazole phosphatase